MLQNMMVLFQTSINLGLKRDSFYDSTDDDSSSSEEEDEDTKREKTKKGKVIKEAFLMKKVYYSFLILQVDSSLSSCRSEM